MRVGILAIATLAATIGLAVPATAQRANFSRIPIIRSESQDFFKQGREQFEEEIQFLVWRTYFPTENLLKIYELPPLEDGPFSAERSNIFANQAASFNPRACGFSSHRSLAGEPVCR